MKLLFKHTSTIILRAALLLGAMAFVNTQTQAQTLEQWAEMPDAFETVDPTTVDWSQEPYFYIQFFEGNVHSFLGEYGLSEVMRGKDYVPYSKSIQWTLEPTGTTGEYYLKSQNGNYIRKWPSNDNYCGASSTVDEGRYKFTLKDLSDGYFEIVRGDYCLGREDGAEWGRIRTGFDHDSPRARLRFARLKSNVAHIIYYSNEGTYANSVAAPGNETRHYLTYSGTDASLDGTTNWWASDISSRKSIIPSNMSLWTLPTAAAYHLDGLWTLQPADVEGNFYIKKYGTNGYLNEHEHDAGIYDCELGAKNASKGIYTLENPSANRYTRIQNVKYTSEPLTTDMFFHWNGYGADASKTSETPASVNLNLNTSLNAGETVFGDGWTVNYLKYADLSGYKKMTITGTPDMQLRVLMDRVEPIPSDQPGYDSDGGAFIEKDVTIGRDGKAVVDLTDMTSKFGQATVKMTYINGSDDAINTSYGEVTTALCGYNKFSSDGTVSLNNKAYGRNYIAYLQVDASAIPGTIKRVTLSGDFERLAARGLEYGVGYNNSAWSSELTWNTADRHYTALGGTQTVAKATDGVTPLSFDVTDAFTDSKVKTIMVYCFNLGGSITNPRVEVEYVPNDISLNFNYAHLNSIKVGGSSPSGTISNITLEKMSTGGNRYLHHADGDGWQALQWPDGDANNNYFYAGFYPVEVVQTDEFYQVLLKVKKDDPTKIKLVGQTKNPTIVPLTGSTLNNLYGATFTPTQDLTNVFQIKNMPTGCYDKIVINFGSAVPEGWYIHAYGEQNAYYSLEGLTTYEITLDPSKTIDDFTIFNWFDVRSPITITECYFTPASPSCDLVEMLNYDGTTDAYSEDPSVRKLWQLEQVNDYEHFRLRAPTGQYFQDDGKMTTNVNDAKIFTNTSLLEKFDLKWFYVVPEPQEVPVDKMVTHKMSYLKQYAKSGLDKQGLATDAQSDWWNYDQSTQKVNHFEITHYVKRNESLKVEFPTILNNSSDHIYYQRWYHYNDESCDNVLYPDGTDIDGLKSHVSLDTPENGNVKYYLYKNGIVTGERVYWELPYSKFSRHANRNFIFTNSDGKAFTVAADVSRYSDMTYKNESSKLEDDLEEPSLTMRYVFYMKDAKEMATKLTACTPGSGKWLEEKTFHFPAKQIFYENQKKAGYRGEFIGLRHVFSDYWVFDGSGTGDDNLVSAVNDGNKSGKIEVEIVDDATYPTGIRKGGYNDNASYDRYSLTDGPDADYKGFYFYDMMDFTALTQAKASYGDSRFIVFRYPASGQVVVPTDPNVKQEAKINVYLNNNGTRYQLAQFTVIFDKGTVTLPYSQINGTSPYVLSDEYKSRDPKALIEKAGSPIAKVTFDYPKGETYHYPDKGTTRHDQGERAAGGTIDKSSPIPLTFDKTNYAFDGGDNCNWGSYAMVSEKYTQFGNQKTAMPANDNTYGYGDASVTALQADKNLQKGFLYIDASEQPGDICSAPFVGDFCAGDKLMFSGWISGSNKAGGSDNRCPGGVTLTVKGEHTVGGKKVTETLYRFCPGQCYELDNGTGNDGSTDATHVVWQQFYFEFTVTDKYDRHWIEVNNNCVSSKGGDFMLDNIEVYCIVPEVIPDVNTPLCVSVDDEGKTVTDMRLLKLSVNYNKLKSSSGVSSGTAELGFVFLEKNEFLKELRTQLATLTDAEKHTLNLDAFNFAAISLNDLATAIEAGQIIIPGTNSHYKAAFDKALLGNKSVWHWTPTSTPAEIAANKGAGVMYFQWNSVYEDMEEYSFTKAVNKTSAVYREAVEGDYFIVMNGNYATLPWKTNTEYYIIPSNLTISSFNDAYERFNLCSNCSKASVFQIEPPYSILGLEKSEDTNDYVVCQGQIPTLLTDLKGYDLEGKEVPMADLNFDWWLGDKANGVIATLDKYHEQKNSAGTVRLDKALSTLRIYYPDVNSLDGIISHLAVNPNPELTSEMVNYLKELVDAGQLVLHQKSVSIPAEPAGTEDPYFYLVACPIHDEKFDQALNPAANQYVAYYCDEPQGLRIKVGEKAPRLKCGFVPNENGFPEYQYPTDSDPVLSIRLAKAAQFETVRNTENEATSGTLNEDVRYLWLPIRDAQTESGLNVIKKAQDDNIYLASSNDPTWDKEIYKAMSKTVPSLPVVGRIVKMTAKNTKIVTVGDGPSTPVDQTSNRLCVYFTKNFEVREGYNYTLSLPFQEELDPSGNASNACDGTILLNLKIVPDYEVWTGGADNSDWNNDDNWRRADGNPTNSSGVNGDELYVKAAETGSPLEGYTTNAENYRTPKDRIFRKGFAPLYCTHVLLKSDEWGQAPELYDAIDGHSVLDKKPFPNLRDKDGWDGDPDTKATATAILRYDMQARLKDIWKETYGTDPEKTDARNGDLLAEMYQLNSCDEIVFQPGTELQNASLLNYNSAWVEYKLNTNRWYLLGSPLQGTLSGEWYAPTGTAQQKTTYYDPVLFGKGYDRYSPAIYQRSWDKAKAVLYEVGSEYSTEDDKEGANANLGTVQEGRWNNVQDPTNQSGSWEWQATNGTADEYLDRFGYKPMGGKKANVAIKGIWSNTYNDAQVDYGNGGFSVMVMNHLKNNDTSGGNAIIRLPKEDYVYDYYRFSETGEDNGGTETDLDNVRKQKNRGLNRGRLKTDLLLPTSAQKEETEENPTSLSTKYADKYGYRTITRVPLKETELKQLSFVDLEEPVVDGASSLGYYLIENPFPCGLNMDKFFAANYKLHKKFWLLTSGGQQLVQYATTGWVTPDPGSSDQDFSPADHVVAPGQGFFVQYNPTYAHDPSETVAPPTTIIFNKNMQAQSRFGKKTGQSTYNIEVGQKQKMEKLTEMVDHDNDPNTPDDEQIVYTNVDLNGNGIYGEIGITLPGETETRDEKEPVMVPVYIDDPNNPGTKIPDLEPIMEDVVVYRYVQSTDEGETFPLKARTRGEEAEGAVLPGLVITAKRGESQSSALVMQREGASNDFLPEEDTEVFINSDLENVPTVYTLCGRLATTINSIHDFRSLPVGVESNSNAPCTLTFKGVETLGDSIAFYDAVEQKLMPLESGMKVTVSGQTQNRYYIVRSLNQKDAAEETHLQIFTEGLTAKVIASTAEPITNVRCFDTSGRLIHSANPQTAEYSFSLPAKGIYIIEAQTDNDRKTVKLMAK